MGRPRTNRTCISEILSVGIRRGWILHIELKKENGSRYGINYNGPIEAIDEESLILINGAYTMKEDVPIPQREEDRIRIYGTEIDRYHAMIPLLSAVVPRWKRKV